MRNCIYILSWQGKNFGGRRVLGVDDCLWIVLCIERGAFGKGCSGHCSGRGLPRLDGNRRGGRGADFNLCVQGASVILENIFPYDAHSLGGGAQKRGVRKNDYLLNSPNISSNSCGIIDKISSTIHCGIPL